MKNMDCKTTEEAAVRGSPDNEAVEAGMRERQARWRYTEEVVPGDPAPWTERGVAGRAVTSTKISEGTSDEGGMNYASFDTCTVPLGSFLVKTLSKICFGD